MDREVLGHGDRLGVATVGGPAGERAVLAQVLLAAPAVLAGPVGPVQPAHADTLAAAQARAALAECVDRPDNLVSGHDGQLGEVELTGDDVQIGAATRAHVNSKANLAASRFRCLPLDEPERCVADWRRPLQHLRLHARGFTARRTWPSP